MFYKGVTIGLDFDGTVVTHEFPKIGKDIPHCIETLKKITAEGGKIILITMRSGRKLAEAVAYMSYHQIPLYGINSNPRQEHYSKSPKIYANIYIDDAALGCPLTFSELSTKAYVDWLEVQKHLFPQQGEDYLKHALMETTDYDPAEVEDKPDKSSNLFSSFFSKLNFS
jgi:hydroxymethylpyrimidine pyrophosphatase-like HAD family hydrolase